MKSGRLALGNYSSLSTPLRLPGGALGWPFVPATVNIGSDIQDRSAFAPAQYPNRGKIPTPPTSVRRALRRSGMHGRVTAPPAAIVTTLGILRPHPETREFVLDAWFAFSGIAGIKANTGWHLKVSPDAAVVPEPAATELAALRQVDETGALRKQG